MWRRLTIFGSTIAVLMAIVLAFFAPSLGRADDGTVPPDIQTALCVGASLDLSTESAIACSRQVHAPRPPARPPDIWAGLCTGASLDLSAASAAACARESTTFRSHSRSQATVTTNTDVNVVPVPTQTVPKQQPTIAPNTPPSTPTTSGTYAAMGDSVAAGAGLEGSGSNTCGRSPGAYPFDVAAARGLPLNHLACKGATARSISSRLSAQMDAAFASGTPALITLTIGANDVQWNNFLRKCVVGSCGTSFDDRAATALLSRLDKRMTKLFATIEERSQTEPPEVVVTGYFNPLSPNCSQIEPRLTGAEIAWLSDQAASLNQTIENAANQFSFTRFVPIDFSGHELCSSDPWVQSVNDPAPFHPTAAGQSFIAQMIN